MNLLAVGFGCLLALLIIEVALRIRNPFESRVKGNEIILPADREYVFEARGVRGIDSTIVHKKNSIGFRGPERPEEGTGDLLSIIAIGGSTTECFYLSDGKDWPALTGECLEEEMCGIWVNNAGLDGHSTFGHTILLRDMVAGLSPDVVMFLVGGNDVAREGTGEHVASQVRGKIRFGSPEAFFKSAAAYSETVSLCLNLYRYLKAKRMGLPHRNMELETMPHSEDPAVGIQDALLHHAEKYVPGFRDRLKGLIDISRENGIIPVFITQPMLFGEGVDPVTGVDLSTVILDERTTGMAGWEILKLYNETIIDVGRQESVLVIDLAGEMEKSSEYFYDTLHFTNSGSAEVARIICGHLKEYLGRRGRDGSSRDRS
jgi:hypothetical protein